MGGLGYGDDLGEYYRQKEINPFRSYNKIFIVKEKDGMQGVIGSSKGLYERHLDESDYTKNIYSFIVFLKLLNAASDAMPLYYENKFRVGDLVHNPMWQTSVDQLEPKKIMKMTNSANDSVSVSIDYDGNENNFGTHIKITYTKYQYTEYIFINEPTETITLKHFIKIFYRDKTNIWYKETNNTVKGPYQLYKMRDLLDNDKINGKTEISKDENNNYKTIEALYGNKWLKEAFFDIPDEYKQYQQQQEPQGKNQRDEKIWYYLFSNQEIGPFPSSKMKSFYTNGNLTPKSSISRKGWSKFHTIEEVFKNPTHFQ